MRIRRRALAFVVGLIVHGSSFAVAAPVPKNPVLLLHGIKDDARKMEPMARDLRAQGWEAHTFSYRPSWGQKGLDVIAAQVAAEADRLFPDGKKFDLVAFSMGGLVGRYYLQRLGGTKRVERFVTISTPHHGSVIAWLLPNAAGRQMRPGSVFLCDLNGDAADLQKLRFTSIWTPFDLIILPARSSEMPGARNVRLPILLHPLMVWQPRALRAVATALAR